MIEDQQNQGSTVVPNIVCQRALKVHRKFMINFKLKFVQATYVLIRARHLYVPF